MHSVSVLIDSELECVCDKIPERLHDDIRQRLGIKKRSAMLVEDLKKWRISSGEKKEAWNRRATLIKTLESCGIFGKFYDFDIRPHSKPNFYEINVKKYNHINSE